MLESYLMLAKLHCPQLTAINFFVVGGLTAYMCSSLPIPFFFNYLSSLRDLFQRHGEQLHFFKSIQHAFLSPEVVLLLVDTKNLDLWLTYQFSVHVLRHAHWKFVIHRLPNKSGKCDWLRNKKQLPCACSENRIWPEVTILVANQKDKRNMASGTRNFQHAAYTYSRSCCKTLHVTLHVVRVT